MNPPITLNKHDSCGSALTFSATAFLRMFGNKGMIFTSTNDYLWCQNLTNIAEQGASQCRYPRPVSGDSGLDPKSKYLPPGSIDGAVEILQNKVEDTRYYLFKGKFNGLRGVPGRVAFEFKLFTQKHHYNIGRILCVKSIP